MNIQKMRTGAAGPQELGRRSCGVETEVPLRDPVQINTDAVAGHSGVERIDLERKSSRGGVQVKRPVRRLDVHECRRDVRDGNLHPVIDLVARGFLAEQRRAVNGPGPDENAIQGIERSVLHAVFQHQVIADAIGARSHFGLHCIGDVSPAQIAERCARHGLLYWI